MKISAFKRQGLAVFEDRGGAGTRTVTCRAGTRLDDWDRPARWADEHGESTSKRDLGRRAWAYRHAGPTSSWRGRGGRRGGRGDRISLFNLKFESFRLTEIKGLEEKILRSDSLKESITQLVCPCVTLEELEYFHKVMRATNCSQSAELRFI